MVAVLQAPGDKVCDAAFFPGGEGKKKKPARPLGNHKLLPAAGRPLRPHGTLLGTHHAVLAQLGYQGLPILYS